ncbi:MAG: secondary thiamine-phosphate synthase enzyme YjbQ [Candidatus Bathyarchaeia archaeon]
MKVVSRRLQLSTRGERDSLDIRDITGDVAEAVRASGTRDGIVNVFAVGSTAALTTIEFEEGLKKDLKAMLERVAPRGVPYAHDEAWRDGNGHSHLRASLLGPSITIPFNDRRLALGVWQQLVFVELDIRSREREVVVQIIGE